MEYTDFTCRQVDDTTGAASQGSILAAVGWAAYEVLDSRKPTPEGCACPFLQVKTHSPLL